MLQERMPEALNEEEADAEQLPGKFRLAWGQAGALLQIDAEMATRVFVPPPTA
jgi:hypothetical protein